jgi:hypothetical protein
LNQAASRQLRRPADGDGDHDREGDCEARPRGATAKSEDGDREERPRWQVHFTPKHASWMNQIECAFSILQRRVLQRGSFSSKDDLRDKLYQYMWWHNEREHPFKWSYRPKSWSTNPAQTSCERH